MIIIIESPNKIKKIRQITGANVLATVGHFKDLPADEMAVDLETYEPVFRISEGKGDVIRKIRAAVKGEDVFVASDPDREGYAIGTHVYEEIRSLAKSIKRAEIHEITEKGVKAALAAAVPFEQTNKGLYHAFLGRRVGDRLVGYLLSPLACAALHGKYSVGRVQSPAV
jgi:DNA topoisomerase I